MADPKTIAELLSSARKALEADGSREKQKVTIANLLVATMPDEIRAVAATSIEAVGLAIDAADEISSRIGAELMFKLIADPQAVHKCEFSLASLASVCSQKQIPLRAGEGIPTESKPESRPGEKAPLGFRPTQAPAKA
jgi:hypothetical protein